MYVHGQQFTPLVYETPPSGRHRGRGLLESDDSPAAGGEGNTRSFGVADAQRGETSTYRSRNLPEARNKPQGNVNATLVTKANVANGEIRIAGTAPHLYLADGIHSNGEASESKYTSSLRSHLLFSINPPPIIWTPAT